MGAKRIGIRNRRTSALLAAIAAGLISVPACISDGHLSLCGYSTKPMYDTNIKTVYVPIFKNTAARDSVRRGIEFDLTRKVIQQIESKTPYKVVSDRSCADTELIGTIVNLTKSLTNINQMNEIRQAETLMTVEVVWRDLRTGEILSGPSRRLESPAYAAPGLPPPQAVPGAAPLVVDPNLPPPLTSPVEPLDPTAPKPPAKPVIVQSVESYTPELGQSTTSALQGNLDRIAVQIISMMESPW